MRQHITCRQTEPGKLLLRLHRNSSGTKKQCKINLSFSFSTCSKFSSSSVKNQVYFFQHECIFGWVLVNHVFALTKMLLCLFRTFCIAAKHKFYVIVKECYTRNVRSEAIFRSLYPQFMFTTPLIWTNYQTLRKTQPRSNRCEILV